MTMAEQKGGLPSGKYTFVGIDVDATGRRISDKIVYLAAHTSDFKHDQYIIPDPVKYLNLAAVHRHQLELIPIGTSHILMRNKTVFPSVKAPEALESFLQWLEKRKASDNESKGIILIYHETIKLLPFMLLEAYTHHKLIRSFSSLVAGFLNGREYCETKCFEKYKTSTLVGLSKMILVHKEDKDWNILEGNASVRARLSYQVIEKLAKAEKGDGGLSFDAVEEFVKTVDYELNELSGQKHFMKYFHDQKDCRFKAVSLIDFLAQKGHDMECIWNEKQKDGLTEIITNLKEFSLDAPISEAVNNLETYFKNNGVAERQQAKPKRK